MVVEKTVAPPVEQRAEELAAATTPPQTILPLTFLQKLEAVYGTALHHSNGTQFDGDIADNKLLQSHWWEIIALLIQSYDVPAGRVGCILINASAEDMKGVEGSQWNSERFIVFQAVILQRMTEVLRARDICQRVKRWIVDWREG